jgi:hypothetical protein
MPQEPRHEEPCQEPGTAEGTSAGEFVSKRAVIQAPKKIKENNLLEEVQHSSRI